MWHPEGSEEVALIPSSTLPGWNPGVCSPSSPNKPYVGVTKIWRDCVEEITRDPARKQKQQVRMATSDTVVLKWCCCQDGWEIILEARILEGNIFYWTNCMTGIAIDKVLGIRVPFLRPLREASRTELSSKWNRTWCKTPYESILPIKANKANERILHLFFHSMR